jgi:hypothetical protein
MLIKKLFFGVVILTVSLSGYAGDLDDGIDADELIIDDLENELNIEFIKRNARAKAKRGAAGGSEGAGGCGGSGNIQFAAGANVQGATIINLSDNTGSTVVCTQ